MNRLTPAGRALAAQLHIAVPPTRVFYVEVDDLAEYLARAEELGGKTVVPPTDIAEFGLTFAFFADPEGHMVGLSKGVLR